MNESLLESLFVGGARATVCKIAALERQQNLVR